MVLFAAVLKDELVDLAHAIDEILADQNRELATDFWRPQTEKRDQDEIDCSVKHSCVCSDFCHAKTDHWT